MNGPARVLNLLHAAHPDDVPAVLALLSDAELDAALADEHCDHDLPNADDRAVRRGDGSARHRTGGTVGRPRPAHLDHRPDRWRVLIELADADPAPVADLVRRIGAELVGQTVRPAGRGVQDLNRTPPVPRPDHAEPAQEGDDV